jgi:hypothetical protein
MELCEYKKFDTIRVIYCYISRVESILPMWLYAFTDLYLYGVF